MKGPIAIKVLMVIEAVAGFQTVGFAWQHRYLEAAITGGVTLLSAGLIALVAVRINRKTRPIKAKVVRVR